MSGIDMAAWDALAQSPRQPLVTVLGWMQAAALAEQHGLPVSSHLFCEFSAHLLAVTPTCQFLEYADWADPIVQEPVVVRDGHVVVPQRPGSGLEWKEEAVWRFLV